MTLSETQVSRDPIGRVWSCLRWLRASPNYTDGLLRMPCSLPRWIGLVRVDWNMARSRAGLFPNRCGLPETNGRSASTTFLSRPARASLALRPADLLAHLSRTLSRGSHPGGYPPKRL